jgi:formylglycine-generating enzyme required for sulfatase activity
VQDAQRLGGSFAQTQGVVSSFTPAYGAPEQFSRSHGSTGPWTDVFALALIFTELMTQEAPLRGDDLTQLAFCSMDPKRRPTPRTYGAVVPDALEAVLRRALAVAPDERYGSMGELWDALRSSLAMEPSRAFATTDSSRSGSNPQLTALAAPGSGGGTARVVSNPSLPSQPLFNDSLPMPGHIGGTGASTYGGAHSSDTSQRTMPTSAGMIGGTTRPQGQPSGGSGALFAVGGAGVLLVVGLIVTGVYFFALRGRDATASGKPVPSPSASVAPVMTPPPPSTCPSGMTKIPGGKFFMGSDDRNDEENERPAHQVTLTPYCIDTTEVTVAQYKACSDRGECKRAPRENQWEGIDTASHNLYDPLCNIREPESRAQHPINCIDWELADAFCKASGRRLPSEAEWEFATRGSDGRKYPWGDEPPTTANFLNACGKECVVWGKKHPDPDNPLTAMYAFDDGFPTTAPAGSFPKGASPFGVQDVVGNVFEWVGDWYAPYSADAVNDPKGAAAGTERVLRGGAWNGSDPAWVRPTYRFKSDPKLRSHGTGVRCAKALDP